MRNNKGFGKYEILTVIVLILCITAFLGYTILGGASTQKIETMKESALSFSKTVTINIASFHNLDTVYLEEVVEEKLMKDIKNPFGRGNCDGTESKVDYQDGKALVTLKCGKYMIENAEFNDKEKVEVFQVGEWTTEKLNKDFEQKKLYNCEDNGKIAFSDYYEELYFVSRVNKEFDTVYYFAKDIDVCKVVSKTFYRTKVSINK